LEENFPQIPNSLNLEGFGGNWFPTEFSKVGWIGPFGPPFQGFSQFGLKRDWDFGQRLVHFGWNLGFPGFNKLFPGKFPVDFWNFLGFNSGKPGFVGWKKRVTGPLKTFGPISNFKLVGRNFQKKVLWCNLEGDLIFHLQVK